MNNHRKYYTTTNRERKVFAACMVVILVVLLVWLVMELCGVFDAPIKPDTVHPLVNSNISWSQTWYKGAWSDAL